MAGCPYCMKCLSPPPLTGEDLAEVVRRKSATSGSLHGLGWRGIMSFQSLGLMGLHAF